MKRESEITWTDLFWAAMLAVIMGFSAAMASAQTCDLKFSASLGGCDNIYAALFTTRTGDVGTTLIYTPLLGGNGPHTIQLPAGGRSYSLTGVGCDAHYRVDAAMRFSNGQTCTATLADNHNRKCYECGTQFLPVAAQHAASGGISAAPGSIISLYHEIFGVGIESAPFLPLPVALGGLSVLIGGLPSPLFYVSPNQVNCLVPPGLAGDVPIRVTRPDGTTVNGDIPLFDSIPGLFVNGGFAAANIERRASVTVLTLWGTGFNIVQGVTGKLDTGTTWLQLGNGRQFQSVYVGPSPTAQGDMPGLDQLNFVLPNADVPPGTIGAVVRLIRSDGRAWNSQGVEIKFL